VRSEHCCLVAGNTNTSIALLKYGNFVDPEKNE